MTNKLKCPFCGDDLRLHEDYVYDLFACSHPTCEKSARMYGTEELWQALIQSQKDLEVARQVLKQIVCADKDGNPLKGVVSCWLDMDELNKCIEQIEHKDEQ